jgi:hypothetical protein
VGLFWSWVLAVRRVGVTKATSLLQDRKLISYRCDLKIASCGCDEADKATAVGRVRAPR